MNPDRLVVIYYKDSSSGHVLPADIPAIDAGLVRLVGDEHHRFTDDEQRDSLLRLTAPNGDTLVVLASALVGYSVSTRQSRRARALLNLALDEENADLNKKRPAEGESAAAAPA